MASTSQLRTYGRVGDHQAAVFVADGSLFIHCCRGQPQVQMSGEHVVGVLVGVIVIVTDPSESCKAVAIVCHSMRFGRDVDSELYRHAPSSGLIEVVVPDAGPVIRDLQQARHD